MGKVEGIFVGVYVLAYAMSKCPWLGGSFTFYSVIIMAILGVVMLIQRFRFISIGSEPRIAYEKAAVFVVGADQPTGWQVAVRCEVRDVRVFAGVEDLQSPTSEWLRRHLPRNTTLVQLRPGSEDDARAAASLVARSLGDRVLAGVVYAAYSAPKMSDQVDLDEVTRGIKINALGAVQVAKAFSPLLQKNEGRFVLVADMAGRVAVPKLESYCMSETVALQYANIIRKMLEKDDISVHLVEPILFNFRKTQETFFYPASSPETGKVLLHNTATKVDKRMYLLTQAIFSACLDQNPKDRYLPSYEDFVMDKIIRIGPTCPVRNCAISYYLNNYILNESVD